jgi:hypothetical protein
MRRRTGCIAPDPGARLRDIAASLGITDLAEAGYIVKQKNGRRNRCQIQAHLPLPEPASRERAVGEVLALLAGTGARPRPAPDGRTYSRHRPATMRPHASRLAERRPGNAGTLKGMSPPVQPDLGDCHGAVKPRGPACVPGAMTGDHEDAAGAPVQRARHGLRPPQGRNSPSLSAPRTPDARIRCASR